MTTKSMWKGRFSEDPAGVVLKFTQSLDLDWRLFDHDIRGSIAHARMLGKVGILTDAEVAQIEHGLNVIRDEVRAGTLQPSAQLEDVHMNIESRLTEILGPVGAKLHTGRSRNDQIATTMRLYLRDRFIALQETLFKLLEALLDRAAKHKDVIVSGYTHLQQAQPISLGHYWMAYFEAFMRDSLRLQFALASLDECPLGSGALAGSTLPLDREFSAHLLGFSCPTRNSLDSVAQRDYMSDYHHFASLFAIHAGRLAEDMVIYSTQEFGWLKLPDAFCTGSSMMPQKKNPDVLELIRGKVGQVFGNMLDLLVMTKGIPMTYDRDLQEDKRGLFSSLTTIEGILEVLVPLLSSTEVDAKSARAGLEKGFALATDVAEYLVVKGMPFRDAHLKVGGLVKHCLANNKHLADLSLAEWQAQIPEVDSDIFEILTLDQSVARRNTYGGTSFAQVSLQIKQGHERLQVQKDELNVLQQRLQDCSF